MSYDDGGSSNMGTTQPYLHASSTSNIAIDPNLDDDGRMDRPLLDGIGEHAASADERHDDTETRLAKVLKAARTSTADT
jgi:hypothetical protein